MPLEIRHLSLAELLSRPIPFHMARYQRHYEWRRQEMDQLLDDLDEVFECHTAGAKADAFHFLGNVILFAHPDGHLEVVDGQQRLTSLTALLAAARDAVGDAGLREDLRALLTVAAPETTGGRQPKLHLHRGDNEFLRDNVVAENSTAALANIGKQKHPGAECLRTNALLAREWLLGIPMARRGAFIRFVLAAGRFVEIQVGTEDDAFRIFETVNSRGRPISSEDVLRYALVEYATDDVGTRDELLARWDAMEAELGPKGMKRFISGWRMRVAKGSRIKQAPHRTLLDSFKSPVEARTFLDNELSSDLSNFQQINRADIAIGDGPVKRRIDTLLRSLSLVDFDDWLPVTLELIARGAGNPERLARDLTRIERLCWYYYLSRDDKGVYVDRRERFTVLMKLVAANGTFDALPPRSLLTAEQCAKMRDCVAARLEPKWVPLRSLLVRLEMALAGDGAAIVRGDLTIEHLLPLHPKSKAWLSLYDNDFETVTAFAEQLGNLCLVSAELNTELGNQTYANKKRLLMKYKVPATSPLAADVAKEAQWTRDVINRRSTWLADVFCRTFDIAAPMR